MASCKAVLFDRDGTLIADVPRNRDPLRVHPMVHAKATIARLRSAGYAIGVVTNQPGVAEGWLDDAALDALNLAVERAVGNIDGWFVCRHAETAGCSCRKPQPGLILEAARAFGVEPSDCVVVGDIESDVDAARFAGARSVLVPTPRTLPAEIERARTVAANLAEAARMIVEGRV